MASERWQLGTCRGNDYWHYRSDLCINWTPLPDAGVAPSTPERAAAPPELTTRDGNTVVKEMRQIYCCEEAMTDEERKKLEQIAERLLDESIIRHGQGPVWPGTFFVCEKLAEAYQLGAQAQRERDAKLAENAIIPEAMRDTSRYTEFERGGDNYLLQIAAAIRGDKEQENG